MRHLVISDILRFLSRPLTRLAVAGLLLAIASAFVFSTLHFGGDVAAAQRRAAATAADQTARKAEMLTALRDECLRRNPGPAESAQCPTPRQVTEESKISAATVYHDPQFHFTKQLRFALTGATWALGGVFFLLGASFVGADWQTRAMFPILARFPRHRTVFGSRILTLAVCTAAIAVCGMAFIWAGAAAAADLRGTFDGHVAWFSLLGRTIRDVALIVFGAEAGLVLAAAFRRTVVSPLVVAVALGIQWLVLRQWPDLRRYSLNAAVHAVDAGHYTIWQAKIVLLPDGSETGHPVQTQVSLAAGAALLAIYLLALAIPLILSIRRRNVL
jgi:ABC-2 type transport system permease protein